jgi:hypothetical protein
LRKVNARARRSRPHRPSRSGGFCAQPRISGQAPAPPSGGPSTTLIAVDGPRVVVYGLENEQGAPIYVDAKAVVSATSGRWSARSLVTVPVGTLPAARKEGKTA